MTNLKHKVKWAVTHVLRHEEFNFDFDDVEVLISRELNEKYSESEDALIYEVVNSIYNHGDKVNGNLQKYGSHTVQLKIEDLGCVYLLFNTKPKNNKEWFEWGIASKTGVKGDKIFISDEDAEKARQQVDGMLDLYKEYVNKNLFEPVLFKSEYTMEDVKKAIEDLKTDVDIKSFPGEELQKSLDEARKFIEEKEKKENEIIAKTWVDAMKEFSRNQAKK